MKKSEIEAGRVYTNGRGRFRLVLDLGAYLLYSSQEDADGVCFLGANRLRAGLTPLLFLRHSYDRFCRPADDAAIGPHCTRASFAAWAKREATSEEAAEVRAVLEGDGARGSDDDGRV